jgi:hypothetical protein
MITARELRSRFSKPARKTTHTGRLTYTHIVHWRGPSRPGSAYDHNRSAKATSAAEAARYVATLSLSNRNTDIRVEDLVRRPRI